MGYLIPVTPQPFEPWKWNPKINQKLKKMETIFSLKNVRKQVKCPDDFKTEKFEKSLP